MPATIGSRIINLNNDGLSMLQNWINTNNPEENNGVIIAANYGSDALSLNSKKQGHAAILTINCALPLISSSVKANYDY